MEYFILFLTQLIITVSSYYLFPSKVCTICSRKWSFIDRKILVSGAEQLENDSNLLSNLNSQGWSSIVIASSDVPLIQKTLFTRKARYSGLLDKLCFLSVNSNEEVIQHALYDDFDCWLGHNLSCEDLIAFNKSSPQLQGPSKLKSALLSVSTTNATLAEMETLNNILQEKRNIFLKLLLHGAVVAGDENQPYDITPVVTNVSHYCKNKDSSVVYRGVLDMILAELTQMDNVTALTGGGINQPCNQTSNSSSFGLFVESGGVLAAAYLQTLRSVGLTRRQELEKLISGGLQRVISMEAEAKKADKNAMDKSQNKTYSSADGRDPLPRDFLESTESESLTIPDCRPTSTEEKLKQKAATILDNAWKYFSSHDAVKSMTKEEFKESNALLAEELAANELNESSQKTLEKLKSPQCELLHRYIDFRRKENYKFITLTNQVLQSQRHQSKVFLRIMWLLMPIVQCKVAEQREDKTDNAPVILPFQTSASSAILWRSASFRQRNDWIIASAMNQLRVECGLETAPLLGDDNGVFDMWDAEKIISCKSNQTENIEFAKLCALSDEMLSSKFQEKYGKSLKASKIWNLNYMNQYKMAVENLKKHVPQAEALPSKEDFFKCENKYRQYIQRRLKNYALKFRRRETHPEQ